MSQPERYRPVLVSKNKVEMQQCVSGDWTSLSCYYLLHDRVVRAEDNCAALAAENERLRKFNDDALAHIAKEERKARGRLEIAEAENELLRKAGDAMMEVLESEIPFTAMNAVNGWLAAKEGGAK